MPERVAFKMKLRPGQDEAYQARHNPIWEDLRVMLLEHGVRHYSIFLDVESAVLFAYAEVEDLERWKEIAQTGVCRRWWDSMAPLMEVNPDNSPRSVDLKEVFHLEC